MKSQRFRPTAAGRMSFSTRLLGSHTVLNGHSFLDFDGFAPAAD
jgi:hypothetical protein